MDKMLFAGWESLFRTLIVGKLAYGVLVFTLRATGKRTLSKFNAFDLVVTVALGSTFATVLLNKDVSLADGALAFALLCLLQYAVTWSCVRSAWVRRSVKSEPRLLVHRGEFVESALRSERVTRDEVAAALRAAKLQHVADAESVVLETDGSLSVIPLKKSGRSSAS